jgi:hypothetical protein
MAELLAELLPDGLLRIMSSDDSRCERRNEPLACCASAVSRYCCCTWSMISCGVLRDGLEVECATLLDADEMAAAALSRVAVVAVEVLAEVALVADEFEALGKHDAARLRCCCVAKNVRRSCL